MTLCLILSGVASAAIFGAGARSALAAEPATETERAAESVARPPADDNDLRRWLENMVWHHRFGVEEITAAMGLAPAEIAAAQTRFDIRPDNRPARAADAPLLLLPNPGGRHPRLGFRDGAIRPLRETKFSVFTPWDPASYVVVDLPEAIWSQHGLIWLAHEHVPTVWTKQAIELPAMEWQTEGEQALSLVYKLPNGVSFTAKAVAAPDAIRMELSLDNHSNESFSDLRVQICAMLGHAAGFAAQTNDNKVFRDPYVACRSTDGRRWIITAWEGCQRAWANAPCPCLHSDPKFADSAPGNSQRLRGWLSFYEGNDLDAELARIEATNWRAPPAR
jgi:hypothetical protein